MSSIEEQFHIMQQQITALQEQLNGTITTPMQSADDTAPPLHSMGTRPRYDWSPNEGLTELMNLDAPLHASAILSDSERKTIIEAYPPMAHLDYRAPATIPSAERMMNKGQRYEDNSLKQLQYLLSAVCRPLDILSHELVSSEAGNPNLERYCTMLQDVRKFLLHVGASMTHARNNISLRVVDPSFSLKPGNEVNYTLPLEEFQNALIQQTAARKATREATINKRQHRRFPNGNSGSLGSFQSVPDQQFFRSGPPSQQGGFLNNTTNNSSNNYSKYNNNNSNNFKNSNFRSNNNNSNQKNSSISDSGRLLLQVVAPKETRSKRRIIKPFAVHPHTEDFELCPMQCFKALHDHPGLQARPAHSNLFVKSNNVNQPLSASTNSTWLHREFISLCTNESGVSIQSLASSRALDLGIPQDSIVALGNWASSDTFVRHNQRNQMAQVDFTSTVLSSQDEFFDASDSFSTLD